MTTYLLKKTCQYYWINNEYIMKFYNTDSSREITLKYQDIETNM